MEENIQNNVENNQATEVNNTQPSEAPKQVPDFEMVGGGSWKGNRFVVVKTAKGYIAIKSEAKGKHLNAKTVTKALNIFQTSEYSNLISNAVARIVSMIENETVAIETSIN